ncbi:HTH-type transcriptional regulator YjiE [Roseovarius litorisediminis]|uniref:HTH-type transcriptional regulator YjiE n=1 Tax=Roseovarius litorisediminis TaxID=1312363 RepID=A0A1Y5TAJ9_9RHOB|nr:LysR family transcriptional regulator [Roseovarius litorisediminis]SLN59128.1 HTH-type transcriptional regulator YjiE [Roseovarius litorisediminis]
MRLEWIEDILAVLDTGSFSAAAERRYLTASAFTRRIRSIEHALGCALFDRDRKPVTLLPHVRMMEFELREAARRFRELRLGLSDIHGQHRKRLSLGCQHALTTMVSPGLARSLGQSRDVELRIRSGTRSACHLMLLRQEVDFGLVYETAEDALEFDIGLFEQIPLGVDGLIPVGNLRDHDTIREALARRDLPLITYPADIYLGEVLRMHILPQLSRETTTYNVAETGLTPAVLQFIRQGLGIGWLPRSVAHESLERGELVDLSGQLPATRLNIRLVRTRTGGNDLTDAAWVRLQYDAAAISVAGVRALTV